MVLQRRAFVADSLGMNAEALSLADRPTPVQLVSQMVVVIGPAIHPRMVEQYVRLAYDLEAYMGAHEGILAWEALDVADFVRSTAKGREARIARCCNLAAVLSWAYGFGGAEPLAMAEHYDTLHRICPADARARAYIRWGADRARGIEDEPPPELEAPAERDPPPVRRRGAA